MSRFFPSRGSPQRWLVPMIALVAVTGAVRAEASQAPVCTEHTEMINHLSNKYSEAPLGIGIASNGGLVEVYASPKGQTWTIVMTLPDGTSCLVAAGEHWEKVDEPAGPKI